MEFLNFNSVELLPNAKASAAFMVDSGKVFREDICTLYSVGFAQVATVRCVITNTFALHSLTRNFLCTLLSVLCYLFCLCLLLINHGNSWSLGNSFFFNMFA